MCCLTRRQITRFLFTTTLLLGLTNLVVAGSIEREQARHQARWQQLQTALFPDHTLRDADGVLELSAPIVPKDPALVPVTIKSLLPQTAERYIQKITLLIDHNPAPLAAVFHLTPRTGVADLKTRVRVNEFSYIRAVAETSDGKLFMAKTFVRASGGCDVAPRIDHDAVSSTLGTMRLRLPGGAKLGQTSAAHLLIEHPNYNGMQVSNTAGVYIPARLVQKVEVSYADRPLLVIDGHLSLSADPQFRFFYQPDGPGEFAVRLMDSNNSLFQKTWPVEIIEPQNVTTTIN